MCDQTERSKEEEEEGSIFTQHSIEVNVEILDFSNGQKKACCAVESVSKRTSSTLQRAGRRQQNSGATAAEGTAPRSLSQASIMSEAAVEELCRLREHYSSQLRRINYISHEHLGQAAEPGLLACIREPLRSLRLPRGLTFGPHFGQTAHSWWTRVSGRRKLMKTSHPVSSPVPNIARQKNI